MCEGVGQGPYTVTVSGKKLMHDNGSKRLVMVSRVHRATLTMLFILVLLCQAMGACEKSLLKLRYTNLQLRFMIHRL